MRRTWKSFLSILLAVTMVFGAVPAVFAEDGQGIDDIVIVNNGSENQENQGTPTPETNEEEKGIQTAADGTVDNGGGTYVVNENQIFEFHLVDKDGNAHWLSPLRSNDPAAALAPAKVWYDSLQGTYDFTLKVLGDFEVDETLVLDFPMTIDLGGHTLSASDAIQSAPVFRVLADVTVKNGTVDGRGGENCYAFIVGNGTTEGNLTIVDGNYYGDVSVASVTNGLLTVEGGYFEATEYNGAREFTLNCIDANFKAGEAKIVVTGGTFKGFNPANNAAEGANTSFCADGYTALVNLDGNYVAGKKPTATVNNQGRITVSAGDYTVYGNGDNTSAMPLSFVMQFLAEQTAAEMETSPYADWYGDFVITFTGIEGGSFEADGCYLAGHYGSFGWVKVPVDDMIIKNGVRYPVMLGVGLGQKYEYICSSVEDFKCAMYLTPEVLAANPNLEVKLELSIVDNSHGEDAAANALVNGHNIYEVNKHEYVSSDFAIYAAKIDTEYYMTLAEALGAAKAGDTIVLLKDVEITSKLTIDKSVTIDGNGKQIKAVAAIQNSKKAYQFIDIPASNVTFKNIVLDGNSMAGGIKIGVNATTIAENIVFDNVTIKNVKADAITVYGSLTIKTYLNISTTSSVLDARNGKVIVDEGTKFDFETWRGNVIATSDLTKALAMDGTPYFAVVSGTSYYRLAGLKSVTSLILNGKTATVLNNIEISHNLKLLGSGSATLNLNGKTFAVADGFAFTVEGNLTVEGTGTLAGEIKLTSDKATLTAPAGLNVTTSVPDNEVMYKDGKYYVGEAVAKIGNLGYPTLDKAFEAAKTGETVVLLADVEQQMVWVPANVTLDLNGKAIKASYFMSFGQVIDGEAGGNGSVAAANIHVSEHNEFLPIYDSANGCYKFFQLTVVPKGDKLVNSNVVKFGVAFRFANTDAYKLIADSNNDSKLTLMFNLVIGENTTKPLPVICKLEAMRTWATNAYNFYTDADNAEKIANGVDRAVTLTVSGLDKLQNNTSLNVTAGLNSIAGVKCGSTIAQYTVSRQAETVVEG